MSYPQQKQIVKKWKHFAPDRWWGDFVDIRFFLTQRLSFLQDQRVLDLGCSAGIIASEAAQKGNRVVGLELVPDALVQYRNLFKKMNLEPLTVCGAWNALMFREMTFDSVVLSWSLYYDRNNEAKVLSIEQIRKILKPGGSIFFVEANRDCYIQGRGLECYWTVEEAICFFESNGFKVLEVLGWNPLPSLVFWLPLKLKMKIPQKLLSFLYPPGRLVQYIPGWYNFFRFAGKFKFIQKYCRTYYLRVVKVQE